MSFIDNIKEKAKKEIKTIVLPEASDVRVLQATAKILKEGFAKIILLGEEEEISKNAKENNLDLSNATIINPAKSKKYEEYVNAFYELRKQKGIDYNKAKELLLDNVYFGMMMVKLRRCRWTCFRCHSFNSKHIKTSTTNIKNSTRNKTCFSIFLNGYTRL